MFIPFFIRHFILEFRCNEYGTDSMAGCSFHFFIRHFILEFCCNEYGTDSMAGLQIVRRML